MYTRSAHLRLLRLRRADRVTLSKNALDQGAKPRRRRRREATPPRPRRARGAARHLERDGLDALDLVHEGGRVEGLVGGRGGGGGRGGAAGDGVGVRHAVLVLDAVLAARRDVLRRRVLVVEDACRRALQATDWSDVKKKSLSRRRDGCSLRRA